MMTLHFFFTGKDSIEIERNLNADLKLISQWLIENNGLDINPTKTEFMLIGTHHKLRRFQPLELYLDNLSLSLPKLRR